MKPSHLLALVGATTVLTACSSGTGSSRVADVPDPTSSTTTSVPAPADGAAGSRDDSGPVGGRPRFRLDDTPQRRTALQVAYNQCLIDHGATEGGGRDADPNAMAASPGEDANGDPVGPLVADPVPAAAKTACLSRLPVMPAETDAATNPRFHEQSLAYVACLEKGGLHVTLLNDDNLDWTYTEGHSVPEDTGRLENDCVLSAFAR